MTKKDAAEQMNLPETATMDEVRSRYQEMYSDYQIRLTNAPTPTLRKVYQRNLEELRTASETLFPGLVIATPQDLPAAEPVQGARDEATTRGPRAERSRTGRVTGRVPFGSSLEISPDAEKPTNNSKMVNIVVIVAGIFGAVALALGILWFNAADDRDALKSFLGSSADDQISYVNQHEKFSPGLKQSLGLLQNGKFSVCNDSDAPITLTWIIASYRGKDGVLHTFNSKNYPVQDSEGNPIWKSWPIGAGMHSPNITLSKGSEQVWDGSVMTFAVGVRYDGQDYVRGGNWSSAQDGCSHIRY